MYYIYPIYKVITDICLRIYVHSFTFNMPQRITNIRSVIKGCVALNKQNCYFQFNRRFIYSFPDMLNDNNELLKISQTFNTLKINQHFKMTHRIKENMDL